MTRALSLALAAAVALPAAAASAGPAYAVPGLDPVRALVLTVARGEQPVPFERQATLRCDPPGGSHARAAEACARLTASGGDPGRVTGTRRVCPMIWAPVTVTAQGVWDGRLVVFRRTYPNLCQLGAATGPVWDF